ncbi:MULTISPECIES: hypothetical protein [unclassified Legionella]|uniref:hypothetical protein n=1 Tax=Legionella sp. PC997 TaxID=2755562 RepID=UPI0015F8C8DF|nr:hypothetical protein [Legionella sp. PC997]QMT60547.1 hypothetical protein HBNCFIEN_01920 [Legionella sp. PC997]
MYKYRLLILLLVISAVIFTPLKKPSCPKQSGIPPTVVSFAITPCSVQQIMNSICVSAPYWLQDEFHLSSLWIMRNLIGLLGFLLIFSKYNSPLDEIYRPPI